MVQKYKIECYDRIIDNWMYVWSSESLYSAKYMIKILSLNNPGAILRLIEVLEFRGN